jgi:putative ABC transport system ATP-binding protein
LILEATGLAIGYGAEPVLSEVGMVVDRGEIVAVVGPSGAGKSSLLLCLCGLLEPQAGEVTLDGSPLSSAPVRVRDALRRQHFGFVFQFGELVPELSLVENVSLPLRLLGRPARVAVAEAHELMDGLGIGHLAAKPVTSVSGGELQRAAICRALVHRPEVVLADEPTGALDEINAEAVFDQLIDHARRRDAAVVVVTHESWLARRADRVLRLDGGRLRRG